MGPKKRVSAAAEAVKKPIQKPTSEPQLSEESLRPLPLILAPNSWTDEQEITLFKAIIKWKPAGMHKHFRMLSIANLMKNHGVADTHTNIPGIWKKLETLYLLEAVDDQEEAPDDGYESPAAVAEFELPFEYYDLKIERAWAAEPSPEAEDDASTKPSAPPTNRKAVTKTKKETKAEAAGRATKRRKVDEDEQKKADEDKEEPDSNGDETEEEASAPAQTTAAAKRKGRTTRGKSAGIGTAKSTPAPDSKEEDGRKKGKGKASTAAVAAAATAKAKQQTKRGRPANKKKEEEPKEETEDDETDEEEEGGSEEAEEEESAEEDGDSGEESDGEEEEEEEEESEEEPQSPASTRRSRSVASTRVTPKGKKAKAPKETVRRSTRKK
ncbi:hypothetical protein DRE_07507 [Drechslerella stenobrocha 248]|uniref:Chromatin modification-related protein EAF7 n=1 Tax=Drechslerella stenobrocha 248 TaxID=1043628 RepID=W7HTX8_9PEZI|nr:hypothetical protein DRE_07507 [Drechslerella stenobrocha 248]